MRERSGSSSAPSSTTRMRGSISSPSHSRNCSVSNSVLSKSRKRTDFCIPPLYRKPAQKKTTHQEMRRLFSKKEFTAKSDAPPYIPLPFLWCGRINKGDITSHAILSFYVGLCERSTEQAVENLQGELVSRDTVISRQCR